MPGTTEDREYTREEMREACRNNYNAALEKAAQLIEGRRDMWGANAIRSLKERPMPDATDPATPQNDREFQVWEHGRRQGHAEAAPEIERLRARVAELDDELLEARAEAAGLRVRIEDGE